MREREHSGLWLWVRLKLTQLMNNVILGNLYPVHEIVTLKGEMGEWEEKFVRFQQYQHFMSIRNSKYDFL